MVTCGSERVKQENTSQLLQVCLRPGSNVVHVCCRVLWTFWQITGDCELIGNRQKETKKIFEELGLGNSAITIITVTYIHLLKP